MINDALTPEDYRVRVVGWAYAQVGRNDPEPYWCSALGDNPARPLHWCGAFALSALHAAGLATDVRWLLARRKTDPCGFILPALGYHAVTRYPKPGDIAYTARKQHHAVVGDIAVDGGLVELINGNSRPLVNGCTSVQLSRVKPEAFTYYSIDGLIAEALRRRMTVQ